VTDREELQAHQYYLAGINNGRSTRKPCPACGRPMGHRPKDGVCRRCQNLLQRAILAILEDVTKTGEVALKVKSYGYREGDYSIGMRFDGPRYSLEEWFQKLVLLVSRPAEDVEEEWLTHGRILPSAAGHSSDYRGPWRLFVPAVAEALEKLDQAIRAALIDASATGRERGANILASLASGEITVDELNRQTIGRRKETE
jgi:hypothetical protein